MIKQLDFISESDNPHKDLADKVNEVIRAQNAMEAANTSTNRRRNEIKPCAQKSLDGVVLQPPTTVCQNVADIKEGV